MIRTYLLFTIFFCMLNITFAQCDPVSDSLALVALYEATDGANWTNTWDLETPINTWYGVTINDNNCVQALVLESNNLTGPIPPELGDLSALYSLSLPSNNLNGSIPPELGSLQNLTGFLSLFSNNLSGSIPPN